MQHENNMVIGVFNKYLIDDLKEALELYISIPMKQYDVSHEIEELLQNIISQLILMQDDRELIIKASIE